MAPGQGTGLGGVEMRDVGEEFPPYLRPQRVGWGSLGWLGGFGSARAGLVCREQPGELLWEHCPFRNKAWGLSISWDKPGWHSLR